MELYLVRHGQSEGNIVSYDVPDGNLTSLGLRQAEEAAVRLAGEGIDLIISSPLRRALQTADALRRRIGAPHEVWRDLLEHRDCEPARFMGRQEVLTVCDGAVCEPDLPEDGFHFGLETPDMAHARALAMIERVRSRFGATERKVAIFAHGGFNAFFLMAIIGRPRQPGCWIDQQNCCINRLWLNTERVRILSVNETAHISEIS
ncbi:MAG TPA: histidine phosphatase family protein [Symbiobacteriaceae bacterium]|nr:histidine phosphatase family protein [Symbiobacteriaceae bacterium]